MSDNNVTEKSSTTAQNRSPSVEQKKKSFLQRNAETFLTDNKDGKAAYLKGEVGPDGKIRSRPRLVYNVVTGHNFKGANQLFAMNHLAKFHVKTPAVVMETEIKAAGTKLKEKPVYFNLVTKTEKDENGNYKPNSYRYYTLASVENPGAVLLLGEYNNRPKRIAMLRSQLEKDESKAEMLLTKIAYEHRAQTDYLIATDPAWKEPDSKYSKYVKDYIKENEQAKYSEVTANHSVPNLQTQYGMAYNNFKKKEEFIARQAEEMPVQINAENTHSPEDYLGKYLAAANLNAEFVTDKTSIDTVQKSITDRQTEANVNEKKYESLYTGIGKTASDNCKKEMSSFRAKSRDEQLGIDTRENDKELNQQRPEQSVEMSI